MICSLNTTLYARHRAVKLCVIYQFINSCLGPLCIFAGQSMGWLVEVEALDNGDVHLGGITAPVAQLARPGPR